eukprot:TRINITY_DN647_c0_g1_i3.p1 TRINITY_DN647_c0_g1~~TRINITY_DN647_c0_g1_i3.p1  ORF type:complete len:191 (+),score=-18.00 TRINITY_DN647_c0_g1_i3:80-574(+)
MCQNRLLHIHTIHTSFNNIIISLPQIYQISSQQLQCNIHPNMHQILSYKHISIQCNIQSTRYQLLYSLNQQKISSHLPKIVFKILHSSTLEYVQQIEQQQVIYLLKKQQIGINCFTIKTTNLKSTKVNNKNYKTENKIQHKQPTVFCQFFQIHIYTIQREHVKL